MMHAHDDAALLVLDVQTTIVEMFPAGRRILEPLALTIDRSRGAGIPVIFVAARFRPGHPEVGPHNKLFGPVREHDMLVSGTEGASFHPEAAPRPGDLVVDKNRVSAFAGTDLESLLRPRGIRHLAVAGIATSGAVLSTVRSATDHDYAVTVLSDCCVDGDDDIQHVLMSKVLPMTADVVTSGEWLDDVAARSPLDGDAR